jgi:predicted metal-dependent HD superfamily phosphohydrolase
MQGYLKLRKQVLDKLKGELPQFLAYHGMDHTRNVLSVCEQYIRRENLSERDRYLLRMGAIVHDMGFLIGPKNHEAVGAEMAGVLMKNLGMKQDIIDQVKGLVMATKIPQTPLNDLQKIICDADLDYLGRDDYPTISVKLFVELKHMNIIATEQQWKDLQINFLKAHRFQTDFARKNREPKKQYWLKKLLES